MPENDVTQSDATPLDGVGTSTTRRGKNVVKEDGENGRHRTGTQGATERPVGASTSRDSTGIDPQDGEGATMPVSGSSS